MKKILLTGSEGFIGSHLLEALVINGFKVKALVQYNSFSNKGWIEYIDKKIFKEIDIVYGDIRDNEYIYNQTKNVDTIINLAALISIPYSYEAYSSYIDTNLKNGYGVMMDDIVAGIYTIFTLMILNAFI